MSGTFVLTLSRFKGAFQLLPGLYAMNSKPGLGKE